MICNLALECMQIMPVALIRWQSDNKAIIKNHFENKNVMVLVFPILLRFLARICKLKDEAAWRMKKIWQIR